MRIAIGADHAGFALKEAIRERLQRDGHEVLDLGTYHAESTDYPEYAEAVGQAVASGRAERGVLVCFTGTGMSIAANKVPGVRAAVAQNPDAVRLTRAHNDANVLALGSKYVNAEDAAGLVRLFLETEFEGGRHARRVAKIAAIESHSPPPAEPSQTRPARSEAEGKQEPNDLK
jgi:ribose 5-phosphate isomerase B